MTRHNIESIIALRAHERPSQDDKPIEEDYWVKLIRKADKDPGNLTKEEIFEVGRYCQRALHIAAEFSKTEGMNVINFTRYLNGVLR